VSEPEAAAPRRVLLAAYYYPPQSIIGARRPHGLAKWLRRRGHDVTVLTSVQAGHGGDDGAASRVVRTRDLLATRLNWRGQSLDVVTGRSDAAWDPSPTVWGSIFVPDVQLLSWAPFALGAALRLQRRDPFDAVVTTSPVEAAHAVGLALRRRGVAWVADLRDGWRFEAPREEWPLRAQRAFDDALERRVVTRADRVVTVSEPLSADLRHRHGIAVETITNGFDPDDAPGELPPDAVDPRKLTLVHTGGLGAERTLAPLLAALARMACDEPTLHERVELVLAGQQTAAEQALYAEPAHAPFVRHLAYVPRAQALALQRAADVLVLATSGVRTGEATGKLYEYLAAGRPVLVLGAGSAAGDIVTRERAGVAIPVRDADAAEAALRQALAGELPAPPAEARAAYAYPALVARYEQLIEQAIAARG
jgi:glycosyltransferase involved in cell wall biosynthesis